ncbi:MAG: tetratricopeptide repeat protein [Helicobacteraceae bacterium]|jgi:tetratricopeptide (TPR) repeat protein|nr:tetratricopeptide repeat protein [Helicobacteraceae bacterium]
MIKKIIFSLLAISALFACDDCEETIEQAGKIIAKNPNETGAYNSRAIAYYKLKEYHRAIEDFTKAIEITPDFAALYVNRGLTFLNMEFYDRAIDDFNQVIALEPNGSSTHYHNRGLAYFRLGELKNAESDAEKACEMGQCYLKNIIESYKFKQATPQK